MASDIRKIRLSSFRHPEKISNNVRPKPMEIPQRRSSIVETENIDTQINSAKEGVIELTKNSKYCVSRFPAIPPILKSEEETYDGLTDESCNYALVQSVRGAFVWDYMSPDRVPNTLAFTDEKGKGTTLSLLVRPSSGNEEPGIFMIDAGTGEATYWESVGGAVADGLLHRRRGIRHKVNLYNGEEIEMLQNVEPAGIVLAVSSGRFTIVTLRDQYGKPNMASYTMYAGGPGLLSNLNLAARLGSTQRDIASIKPASTSGKTERQVLFINTNGDLSLWECSRTGAARQLVAERLKEILISSIEGVYTNARATFQTHDVEMHEDTKMRFVLASFINSTKSNQVYYILYSLEINSEGRFHIFSAHRLQSHSTPSAQPPKLLLPKPGKTLFAIFSNAVVLIDSIPEKLSNGVYTRWEDSVNFRDNAEIIGSGIENIKEVEGKITRNPAAILIIRDYGVVRVERFSDHKDSAQELTGDPAKQEEAMARTKIEQAVFYGQKDNNPVDFVARRELSFNHNALEKAAVQISHEILATTSTYMPPVFPSLNEHIALRVIYLGRLAEYLRVNFSNSFSTESRFQLLWDLEKASSSKALWSYVDGLLQSSKQSICLSEAIRSITHKDTLRDWFIYHACDVDKLLIKVSQICQQKKSIEALLDANSALLKGVYVAALEVRNQYMEAVYGLDSNRDVGSHISWTTTPEMMETFEAQYEMSREFVTAAVFGKGDAKEELCNQLVMLVETLCALNVEKNQYRQLTGKPVDDRKYMNKRGEWIHLLAQIGEKEAAITIADKYAIFRPLVEIVGEDWRLARLSDESEQEIEEFRHRMGNYLCKFGYDFASIMYQYWIDSQQFKMLLEEFPAYKHFREQFFSSGKYNFISWISEVADGNFTEAGRALISAGSLNNDDSAYNKKLNLSMAKLCILASSDGDSAVSLEEDVSMLDNENEDILQKINLDLEKVTVQEKLQNQILLDQSTLESLKEKGYSGLEEVVQRALSRLNGQKSLSPNELVDLLTLLPADPVGDSQHNFVRALKIAYQDGVESRRKINEQLIWNRLFRLDDWPTLAKTKNKSDSKMQQISQNTMLFKTLNEAFRNVDLSDYTVTLLSSDPIGLATKTISKDAISNRYSYADREVVKNVVRDIQHSNEELKEMAAEYGISEWVKGIFSRLQM